MTRYFSADIYTSNKKQLEKYMHQGVYIVKLVASPEQVVRIDNYSTILYRKK
jgi:hypothetical protein